MKKILNAIGLIADLAMPVLTVIIGVAVMIGGATGTLWL